MRTHGKASTYGIGCRCESCKAAHAKVTMAWRHRRSQRLENAPHGTADSYKNWLCRCDPCCEAGRAYYREWRKGKRDAQCTNVPRT